MLFGRRVPDLSTSHVVTDVLKAFYITFCNQIAKPQLNIWKGLVSVRGTIALVRFVYSDYLWIRGERKLSLDIQI